MTCKTENCGRARRTGHAYCEDCERVVMRTGRPPVLPVFVPAWRQRLVAKDMTGRAA